MKPKSITLYDFVEGQSVHVGRFIARVETKREGPNLVFIGGMHGNEPTGVLALNRAMKLVARLQPLLKGNVYALAGNLTALERGERYIRQDLNRIWHADQVERARTGDFHPDELIDEVEEQIELWGAIDALMHQKSGPFYFADLHTTSTLSAPFITMSDTIMNRRFVRGVPVPIVIGIEEHLSEPLLSYLNELGCVSVAFEGGQHSDSRSLLNHEAFIWLTLVRAGIMKPAHIPDFELHKDRLRFEARGYRHLYEVRFRQGLEPGDHFQMLPGFDNFDKVRKNQILGRINGQDVRCTETGLIFMPLYQSKGEDAWFLIRRISTFWMAVSYLFRRLNLYKILRLLPGVRPFMGTDYMMVVNREVARWYSTELLHLMGYRRKKQRGPFTLFLRRKYDFKGPRD
jgi:predicted deacylase